MSRTISGRRVGWEENELLDIRLKYLKGFTQDEIAEAHQTTQKTISKIVNLTTYPDIGVPPNYTHNIDISNRKIKRKLR